MSKFKIVKVSASWCLPCRKFAPSWNTGIENYPNWEFVELDADNDFSVVSKLRVNAVPTFIVYENGVEVERWSGANPGKFFEALNNT